MSQKMTRNDLVNLVLVALYQGGLLNGPDLMANTGLSGAEAKDIVNELMNKKGLVGQDGDGKGAKFGLTEEGLTYVEKKGLVEAEGEDSADEGQFEDAEELTVDDSDEFAQEQPAKRPTPRAATPAPRTATTSKAPTPAPRPSAAGASKAGPKAAPPARVSSKAAPAPVASKKAAPKRVAEVEEDGAEPVWRPKSITSYDEETLQTHVDVVNDYVGQLIDAAKKGKDGFPLESDPNAILAITLMRQNKRNERRLETGNYVGGANEGGGGKE